MRCRSCAQRFRWVGDATRREKLRSRNRSVRSDFPYENAEWLRAQYAGEKALRVIAKECGCSLRTIARWMAIHGIATRDMSAAAKITPRSGDLSGKWRGGRKPCPKCGRRKSFYAQACMTCRGTGYTGDGNPNYRGVASVKILVRQWCFDHWRPRVFARDGYRCQSCGDARGGNLCAHHVRPLSGLIRERQKAWPGEIKSATGRLAFVQALLADPEITSIENGQTLCEDCHRAVHRRAA